MHLAGTAMRWRPAVRTTSSFLRVAVTLRWSRRRLPPSYFTGYTVASEAFDPPATAAWGHTKTVENKRNAERAFITPPSRPAYLLDVNMSPTVTSERTHSACHTIGKVERQHYKGVSPCAQRFACSWCCAPSSQP